MDQTDNCTCDQFDISMSLVCPKHSRRAQKSLDRVAGTMVALDKLLVEPAACLCGPNSDLWEIAEFCPRHGEVAREALDQIDEVMLRREARGFERLLNQIRDLPETHEETDRG